MVTHKATLVCDCVSWTCLCSHVGCGVWFPEESGSEYEDQAKYEDNYQTHTDYSDGDDHGELAAYCVITLSFCVLCVFCGSQSPGPVMEVASPPRRTDDSLLDKSTVPRDALPLKHWTTVGDSANTSQFDPPPGNATLGSVFYEDAEPSIRIAQGDPLCRSV